MSTCVVDGCDSPRYPRAGLGMCSKHYQRWRRYGSTELPVRPAKKCRFGCDRPYEGLGLCDKHYQRYRTHGDPEALLVTKHTKGQTCARPGCDKPVRKVNLCASHYTEWWRVTYPDDFRRVRRQCEINRRARQAAASGSHSRAEWLARQAEYGGLCAYCGVRPGTTRDHVVPLVRGGSNSIDNIVPACRSCNASKCDRLLSEWTVRPA